MKMHELPESCKDCQWLRCLSVYMDGAADYACNHKLKCEVWKEYRKEKEDGTDR